MVWATLVRENNWNVKWVSLASLNVKNGGFCWIKNIHFAQVSIPIVSLSPAQPFQRKAVLSFMTGYLHMRKFAPEIVTRTNFAPEFCHITAPAASLDPGNLWYHLAHKSVFYTGLRISSTGAAAFIISVWLCFLFFAFLNNCKFFLETMPTLWLWGEAVSSQVGPEWATMERRLLLTLGRKTIGWFLLGGVFLSDIFIFDF